MSDNPKTAGAAPPGGPVKDGARGTGPALESHYRFLLWLVPAVEHFPRSRKFLLGDRIRRTALDVLEALIDAAYTRQRTHHLARANLGIEKLRFLFRLAHDLRALDHRRYEHAARSLDETGRSIGAWSKTHRARAGDSMLAPLPDTGYGGSRLAGKENTRMSNAGIGPGTLAPRIRRCRGGWRRAVRLGLAVLACTFAGAGQAQISRYNDLDAAVGALIRGLVKDGDLPGKRVFAGAGDFFEEETELRLPLSNTLRKKCRTVLTESGVEVPQADEPTAWVLHGRWQRESEKWLHLTLFIAEPVEQGEPDATESKEALVRIENIRPADIEPTLRHWGDAVVRRLDRGVRDQRRRSVLLPPFSIEAGEMAQPEKLGQSLTNWLGEALVVSRMFEVVEPVPGVSVQTDGKLLGKVLVYDEHIEVGLRVRDSQGRRVTYAKVTLDKGLFPNGTFGPGVAVVVGPDPTSTLERCAGDARAGRSADAVKCYAGVLKETPGDQGALAGLEDLKGTKFRDCDECPELVVVPSGSYEMGSPSGEAGRGGDEGPVHRVTFERPFAVGVYEVTFGEWDACVSDNGCGGYRPGDEGWGRGPRPVIHVNWDDAKAYVGWLSRKTGEEYRLLSESEWEYVARAGTTGPFHTGSTISTERANYHGGSTYGSGRKGQYRKKTIPVGSFPANGFGLHDVHGNVWEWVEDCYSDGYVGAPVDGSAWEWNCDRRVLRGGSWDDDPVGLRSADRFRRGTGDRLSFLGFRIARTLTP